MLKKPGKHLAMSRRGRCFYIVLASLPPITRHIMLRRIDINFQLKYDWKLNDKWKHRRIIASDDDGICLSRPAAGNGVLLRSRNNCSFIREIGCRSDASACILDDIVFQYTARANTILYRDISITTFISWNIRKWAVIIDARLKYTIEKMWIERWRADWLETS